MTSIRTLFSFLILCGCAVAFGAGLQPVGECSGARVTPSGITLQCAGGATVSIQVLTSEMVRVRLSSDGRLPESLPIRWGFVRDNWTPVKFTTSETDADVSIVTPALSLRLAKRPLRLTLLDHAGKTLLEENAAPAINPAGGFRLEWKMDPAEHFYGLGFQRTSLDVRGKRLSWQRGFRWNEATVPYFMSTRGYAFYSNNTWKHTFDFTGQSTYSTSGEGGQADYYIFYGPSMKRLLDRYTDLTGKPMHTPRWSFGLGYQCRYFEEQEGVLAIARRFRSEDIPLDMMGLEPGWEEEPYSMKWIWSHKGFPNPEEMIRKLGTLGVKMELWESGDAPKTGYTNADVRAKWFNERVAASLGKGVRWYKQDDPYPRMIKSEELMPADFNDSLRDSGVVPVGEVRNITNSLYSDTVFKEMRRITGQRAMVMFNSYNSSIASHRWPFTWGADFVAGVGSLNAGLSGHSMVSVAMNNEELTAASQGRSGTASPTIHVGYLMPFAYLESWAYFKEPWLYSEELLEANRFYTKLRYRLLPYLYSTAHQSVTSGVPMMRAMVLEYQDDPETYQITSQFMLGDWLLVGTSQPKIYLPAGNWIDYWTGAEHASKGEWQACDWPLHVGGPLFVKAGAIVPMGPVMSHSEEEPLEVVNLDLYPCPQSRYSLYEDDGLTYGYETGASASTEIEMNRAGNTVSVSIGERKGSFPKMPLRRAYLLSVHVPHRPLAVRAGGKLQPFESRDALTLVAAHRGWYYDAARRVLWVKATAGWRYDYDQRGAKGDPERDTAVWESAPPPHAYQVKISLPDEAQLRRAQKPAPAIGPAARLSVALAAPRILADGHSGTLATISVVDAAGERVAGAANPVRVSVSGNALLGCGRPECDLAATGGVVETRVTSTGKPGALKIHAVSQGLKDGEATLEAQAGSFELMANPPERIKLRYSSWLSHRITLYATIKANGTRVKEADNIVRLHVTGPNAKMPADREVRAVRGIAVFKDVYYDPPSNYKFEVTSEGLPAASIPIY